ncbi:MAG: protein kinase [Deltaproteobacteria bacterium]
MQPTRFGDYWLLSRLGQGATGDVFLASPATERGLPSKLVVKRLHAELTSDADFVRRFRHEAEVASHVDSPNVAQVFDAGRVGDTLYIAMRYIAGWSLVDVMDRMAASPSRSQDDALALIEGALRGLADLHTARARGSGRALEIVHRDISPKNIVVSEDGASHLIDLGIGRSALAEWRTKTGTVMGTLGYMAPEQVRGEHVDARADVFAMGVVLYELLTLERYIEPGPLAKVLSDTLRRRPTPPSAMGAAVSPDLDAIVVRALDPDPTRRFANAANLRSELGRSAERMPAFADTLISPSMRERYAQTESERTRLVAAAPRGDEPAPERTEVFLAPTRVAPRATPRRRWPTVAGLVVTLVAGVLIGRFGGGAGDAPPPLVPPPIEVAPKVAPRPSAVGRPAPALGADPNRDAVTVAEHPERGAEVRGDTETPRDAERPERAEARRAAEQRPHSDRGAEAPSVRETRASAQRAEERDLDAAPRSIAGAEASADTRTEVVGPRVRDLIARARRARAHAEPDRAAKLDAVLARLVTLLSAPPNAATRAQIEQEAAALREVEVPPPR